MTKKALEGVKIADFSWVWAGPYGTLLLSFLGADVVKVESKKRIDQTRQGSITMGEDYEGYDASPIFNNANLNKRSVTLDLKSEEAIVLAKKLVAASDVVVENMRPGVMDKLGLGYEDLKKVREDIIYVAASGFGGEGPYGHYAGYAPIFASFGGLAHLTGYADAEPNTMSGVMDLRVGTMTASAVIAALLHRQKTGEGQFIDLSSSECISSLIGGALLEYSLNGTSPSRAGNDDEVLAPNQVYRCDGEDRWISISVGNDAEWEALKDVMGRPAWAEDESYADQALRHKNRRKIDEQISAWTKQHKSFDLWHKLEKAGVAAAPSMTSKDILTDAHVRARGATQEVEHPILGTKIVVSPPWKLSETPAVIEKCAPKLGEHNMEVFTDWAGLSREEVEDYIRREVIY